MSRTHTPPRLNPNGSTTIKVQRACNGCQRPLGDATDVELDAAMNGEPLPDVRGECGCLPDPGRARRARGSGNGMHCHRDDHEMWRVIMRFREKADAKHGPNGIEQIPADDPRWLSILVEEIGEVAHALTYDATDASLDDELLDVLAVASAWLSARWGYQR
jgi:hypothetical protein